MDLFSNLPFDFEPQAYHDGSRAGYVVLVSRSRFGERRPRAFALRALRDALAVVDLASDAWISAAEYRGWDIRPAAADAAYAGAIWAAFDYGKVPAMSGWPAEKVITKLLQRCSTLGIPEPTLIVVWSSRLEVKWVVRTAVPSCAFSRWRAVQRELCRKFAEFGPDHGARSVLALFRVVGSIDTASGSVVRVAHCARTPSASYASVRNGLVAYDFDRLAASILPHTREEVKAFKKRMAGADAAARNSRWVLKPRTLRQLVEARLDDLRTLVKSRGLDSAFAPVDQRELMAFWGAAFLAQLVEVDKLPERIAVLVQELELEWDAAEIERRLNAVLERARNVDEGNDGPGHYTPDNDTLIGVLGITAAEQLQMSTIIGDEEGSRRHRERQAALRRKRGIESRDEKAKVAGLRRGFGRAMRQDDIGWDEIAFALDYPSADAARVDCGRD